MLFKTHFGPLNRFCTLLKRVFFLRIKIDLASDLSDRAGRGDVAVEDLEVSGGLDGRLHRQDDLLPCKGEGYRVQGTGYRVQGSGLRVQGSGCRVQGSGFGRPHPAQSKNERFTEICCGFGVG